MENYIKKPILSKSFGIAERMYLQNEYKKEDIQELLIRIFEKKISIEEVVASLQTTVSYIQEIDFMRYVSKETKKYIINYISYRFCETNEEVKELPIRRKLQIYKYLSYFNENYMEAVTLIKQLRKASPNDFLKIEEEVYTVFTVLIYENIKNSKLPHDLFIALQEKEGVTYPYSLETYIILYHNLLEVPSYAFNNTEYITRKQIRLYHKLMQDMSEPQPCIEEINRNFKEEYQLYLTIFPYLVKGCDKSILPTHKEKVDVFIAEHKEHMVGWENSILTIVSDVVGITNIPLYSRVQRNEFYGDEKEYMQIAYIINIILSLLETTNYNRTTPLTQDEFSKFYLCTTQLVNSFSDTHGDFTQFIAKVEGSSFSADKANYLIRKYMSYLVEGDINKVCIPTDISTYEYLYHLPTVNDFILWKRLIESYLVLAVSKDSIMYRINNLNAKLYFYNKGSEIYEIAQQVDNFFLEATTELEDNYIADSCAYRKMVANLDMYVAKYRMTEFIDKFTHLFEQKVFHENVIMPFVTQFQSDEKAMYVLNKNYLFGNYQKDEKVFLSIASQVLKKLYYQARFNKRYK